MGHHSGVKKQVRIALVGASGVGQRIDNFLVRQLPGVPGSHLYKLLRKGQFRVNGKRVRPDYRLLQDDQVRIPPMRVAEHRAAPIPQSLRAFLARQFLFEDERIAVLSKPAGIPVHRGSGVRYGIADILPSLREDARHWSLAHRLDRDTSGCLIIAKNRQALLAAQDLFRRGEVVKEYLVLTAGHWPEAEQVVDVPLRRNVLQGGERIVMADHTGKQARSHFAVARRYRHSSLMRVVIETGRTHQIRVHARHSGHPVAGDLRYGDKTFNRALRGLGLQRMFLHAHRLQFTLGGPVEVQAPLPEDLTRLLAVLQNDSPAWPA